MAELPLAQGLSAPDTGALRLRTLVLIRWVAVIGQAGAVLAVHLGLGFDLPLAAVSATIFAAAVTNVAMAIARPAQARLSDREGAVYFAFDILQLALLLFLTGGVQNPFAILLLAPVAIAASTLSGRSTLLLSALALASIAVIARFHLRLPWPGGGVELPLVYQLGMAAALATGTLFIAFYAWSLAHGQRRMSEALSATQAALAREHRLSALGGLAAAAAHELGSPLSTIAVVAHELKRAVPRDSPLAEDIALLVSQSDRCRAILAMLAERPEQCGGAPYERLPASALVAAALPALGLGEAAGIAVEFHAAGDGPEPVLARAPEVLHGLGNLLENARQFATSRVDVTTRWRADELSVLIEDDGPGFDPGILGELGEPYLTTRRGGGHMGLGVFIAKTLLERTGARIAFGNRPGRLGAQAGAAIAIRWRRADIQAGKGNG
ncbi:MAG: ActS/PrrB/RegB family redox-sensitive histidine kinase [Rhodospirillales bacterium]